jgi:hypothetical protein
MSWPRARFRRYVEGGSVLRETNFVCSGRLNLAVKSSPHEVWRIARPPCGARVPPNATNRISTCSPACALCARAYGFARRPVRKFNSDIRARSSPRKTEIPFGRTARYDLARGFVEDSGVGAARGMGSSRWFFERSIFGLFVLPRAHITIAHALWNISLDNVLCWNAQIRLKKDGRVERRWTRRFDIVSRSSVGGV